MTAMLDWTWPDGTEVLIRWLTPLGEVRDERPTGGVLPYRMVNRLPSPSTPLVDTGTYSVHTFARKKADAQAEAMLTHRRILLLATQWAGQEKVTLQDGTEVFADNVVVNEFPHWVQWDNQNSIHRYVGTYRIDLRLIAAT